MFPSQRNGVQENERASPLDGWRKQLKQTVKYAMNSMPILTVAPAEPGSGNSMQSSPAANPADRKNDAERKAQEYSSPHRPEFQQ